MKLLKLFLLLMIVTLSLYSKDKVLQQNFESSQIGKYSDKMVEQEWENIQWSSLFGRGEIVEDTDTNHAHILKIFYPKGSVGPNEGGGQFVVNIPPSDEYWLSYYVKFDENFDFQLGGKLPGLTSGGEKYTGGHKPKNGEGWSARFMWRENGKAVVYFYSVGMEGKWGDDLPLNKTFVLGKWHKISQHIKVNEDDKANGILEVWLDSKKVMSRSDVLFRLGNLGLIDSFYFSTFFGGNTKDWGPDRDCFFSFNEFMVWTE